MEEIEEVAEELTDQHNHNINGILMEKEEEVEVEAEEDTVEDGEGAILVTEEIAITTIITDIHGKLTHITTESHILRIFGQMNTIHCGKDLIITHFMLIHMQLSLEISITIVGKMHRIIHLVMKRKSME